MRISFTLLFTCITWLSFGQNKILFDASKAQAAGNADWVIDADLHNIFFRAVRPYPIRAAPNQMRNAFLRLLKIQ